ncbi:MAG: MMPL family transporter [Elusimicrobia bacterium]|nr:MMPL family transporter [Elusimicrobiota bacterium]
MMHDLVNKALKFLARRYLLVIAVYAVITAAAAYFSSNLRFESSFEDLLPRSFASVQALDDITKEFGGTGYLVLDVESDNLEKSKQFSADLVREIEKLPEVKYVNWRQPKQYFDDRRLLYMDLDDLQTVRTRIEKKIDFEKQKANPLFIDLMDSDYKLDLSDIEKKYEGEDVFRDYYVSKDGRELVLLVKPNGLAANLAFSRKLVGEVQGLVDKVNPAGYHPSIKVSLTGRYKKQVDLNNQLIRDLTYTGIGATLLVLVLLVLYFKQKRPLLLIVLPMASGLFITFGVTYLVIGYVNIISAFLVSILMGISADYGIVLYSRYTEEMLKGRASREAVIEAIGNTWQPIVLSGLTTGLVFLSLLLAQFKGFSQFGFIAGIGVFLNMFVFFTLFPALILLLEKLKPARYSEITRLKASHINKYFYIPVLIFTVFFTAYSVYRMKDMKFEYNFSKIQGSNIPSFILDERINGIIGTSLTPDLVMVNSLAEARAVSKVLEQKEKNPDTTIDSHASLLSFLPKDQDKKLKVLREIRALLDDTAVNVVKGAQKKKIKDVKKLLEVKEIRQGELPPEILRMFCGSSPDRSAVFIFPKINLSDAALVKKSSDEIRDLRIPGRTAHPCSESIIFSDIINMVVRDGRIILPLAFLLTAIPVILAYRNVRNVTLVLLPLSLGFVWIFGILAIFHIKFNFFNVLMLPLIFGMGDDYGEYVHSRYAEEGPGSIHFVMSHTGPAVFMSATTTFIGFGSMLFASHYGLRSIAVMAAIGISCVFFAAMLLQTSMIILLEKLDKHKNDKRKN